MWTTAEAGCMEGRQESVGGRRMPQRSDQGKHPRNY